MKEKTSLLLEAAAQRRKIQEQGGKGLVRRLALDSLLDTKDGKKLQRKLKKARKAVADKLREIRRTEGHQLARVFARVP